MPQASNPHLLGSSWGALEAVSREARISLARCKLSTGTEENPPSSDHVHLLPVVKHLPWVAAPKSKSKPRRVCQYTLKGETITADENPETITPDGTGRIHLVDAPAYIDIAHSPHPKTIQLMENVAAKRNDCYDPEDTSETHYETQEERSEIPITKYYYCHPLTSLALLTQPILTPVKNKPGVPKHSECKFTFIARGQGKDILKRLLQRVGWSESPVSKGVASLNFHFCWCSYADIRQIWHELQPWQLVNHSPSSSSLSSKVGFLRHLRQFCPDPSSSNPSDDSSQTSLRPLHEFVPRSYDLKSSEDLRTFLFDFAVTQAEAASRGSSQATSDTSGSDNRSLMEKLVRTANATPRWLSNGVRRPTADKNWRAIGIDQKGSIMVGDIQQKKRQGRAFLR